MLLNITLLFVAAAMYFVDWDEIPWPGEDSMQEAAHVLGN
jgi:hypothetical protein